MHHNLRTVRQNRRSLPMIRTNNEKVKMKKLKKVKNMKMSPWKTSLSRKVNLWTKLKRKGMKQKL
jgi:predicted acetyltransferase